eukprot:767358-Hanusia_phi.AAC.3
MDHLTLSLPSVHSDCSLRPSLLFSHLPSSSPLLLCLSLPPPPSPSAPTRDGPDLMRFGRFDCRVPGQGDEGGVARVCRGRRR